MPVVIDGTNGITTPDLESSGPVVGTTGTFSGAVSGTTGTLTALTVNGNNISAVNSLGFRNRIINGDCRIDQRNAGASVAITGVGQFLVDRFALRMDASTGTTAARSTVAPSGFSNSLIITVGTGAAPSSTQVGFIDQRVEGFNVADLSWGNADAQSITVSFRVRSSLTGSFGAAIRNSATNRCYVFPYTINAANTWEIKTVTIPGDTSGTWLTDNGVGLYLSFDIGEGSNRSASTTNSWLTTNTPGLTGGVKLCATSGATFYITGVQLEAGTVASPFERVNYTGQLAMCQRYYQQSYVGATPAALSSSTDAVQWMTQGAVSITTGTVRFPVEMRGTPTLAFPVNQYNLDLSAQYGVANGATFKNTCGFSQLSNSASISTGVQRIIFHYTASAEL